MAEAAETTPRKRPAFNRMYARAVILGYKRSKVNVYPQWTLVKVEGAEDRAASQFYMHKKVAWVYKAKTLKAGSKFRVIWGKVVKPHGNSGVLRCRFKSNLPACSHGKQARVYMYPSTI